MTNPSPGFSPGEQPSAVPGDVPTNVPSRAELRARRAAQATPHSPSMPQSQPQAPDAQPRDSAMSPVAAKSTTPGGPALPWVSPTGKAPGSSVSPIDSFAGQSSRNGSGSSGGGSGRGRTPGRKKKQIRALVAVVVSLTVVAFGANFVMDQLGGNGDGTTNTGPAADYPGPGEGSVVVSIPNGASGTQMAQILAEADVVSGPEVFIQAFNANPNAIGIQPGTFEMPMQMKAADAVALLIADTSRIDRTVTIPEGQTVKQIVSQLSSALGIPEEEFYAALDDPESIGLPAEAGGNAEGWLRARTYPFPPETTATQALTTMVRQTELLLDGLEVPEEERQDVLIKASLIEREARLDEDRPKVARAIENRLEVGMILQIDASLAYGLDKSGMDLTYDDQKVDNPYNLEMNKGLPPTPIASPGDASIRAVLEPADGPWIFWVTVNLDTGETKFSETYSEHQEYVAELRQWQRENGLRD